MNNYARATFFPQGSHTRYAGLHESSIRSLQQSAENSSSSSFSQTLLPHANPELNSGGSALSENEKSVWSYQICQLFCGLYKCIWRMQNKFPEREKRRERELAYLNGFWTRLLLLLLLLQVRGRFYIYDPCFWWLE